MLKPYTGITGFTKREDVESVVKDYPINCRRTLMVGVVTTHKSLRAIPMKLYWQKQTPAPTEISNLFLDDSRVLNLIHYSTETGQENTILRDLLVINKMAGPNIHGFQLNLVWPSTDLLSNYILTRGNGSRIVLQISNEAIETAGGTPESVAAKLRDYRWLIDDILIDPSGGRGKEFNPEWADQLMSAIRNIGLGFGLGVAGGLSPDTLHLLEPLIEKFPDVSIDAQSRLRDKDNDLNLNSAKKYVQKSLQFSDKL